MIASPAADAFEGAELCDVCGRESCEDHLPPDPEAKRHALALTLSDLAAHQFPARPALVTRNGDVILRAGHLGEVVAGRGIGKTWFLMTLGIVAASDVSALGFRAPSPCRVVYIDGEMAAEELQTRAAHLTALLGVTGDLPLTFVAADWQENYLPRLDTQVGQDFVEPFIEAADLVIIDNRSCLFDSEGEKDAAKWQPAQDWLLSLRRRGKAVLLAHHANRQGSARGHSKAEDALNLLLTLTRPDDYTADQGSRFVVAFDKARGVHGEAVAPFTARLTPEGWHVDGSQQNTVAGRLLHYVRLMDQAGERVKSASAAIKGAGVNKTNGLKAWADMKRDGIIGSHPEGGFYAV